MINFFSQTKVIHHNAGCINLKEDPTFPYKVEVVLSPPEFMSFAFIMRFGGSERFVVQGKWLWGIKWFTRDLRTHPRLLRYTFTGPNGTIEQLPIAA